MFKEYPDYDGLGLAELIRGGQVQPLEVLEAAIARAEAINPKLNAIVTPLYDYARQRLKQPLTGPFAYVPFLLKDVHHALAGTPMSNGSALHRGEVSAYDAEIVRRYLAAGTVVFGKTNTPEYKLSYTTHPKAWGPTRNPWDLTRTPGGSSGGSAAAVAARIVPMASGTDEAGSIRTPASFCGLFGLKPSRGRNPIGPDLSWHFEGLSTSHVLTRSVRDSAAMLDATCGPEPHSPYSAPGPTGYLSSLSEPPPKLRVALCTAKDAFGRPMDAACVEGVVRTGELLRELGHSVEEVSSPFDELEAVVIMLRLGALSTASLVSRLRETYGSRVDSSTEVTTRFLAKFGESLSEEVVASTRSKATELSHDMAEFHKRYDVLVTPTLGRVAPALSKAEPRRNQRWLRALIASAVGAPLLRLSSAFEGIERSQALIYARHILLWTPIANLTGQPAMSVPLHYDDGGLPCGVQFIGRLGEDGTLLRLAAQLEKARPWQGRFPVSGAPLP